MAIDFQEESGGIDFQEGQPTPKSYKTTEPENQVRPRTSIGGEFFGGLKDILDAIAGPSEGDSLADRPVRAVLGAARTLSSPFSPLANAAAGAGESVSNALQSVGLKTGADIGGALTEAAVNVLPPIALDKFARVSKGLINAKLPLKSERVAVLESERAAGEAAIKGRAADKLAQANADAESAASSQRSITQAEKDYAREQASKARGGVANSERLSNEFAPNAPSAEEVGANFQVRYQDKLAQSKDKFSGLYNELENEAAGVSTDAANYKAQIEKTLGEKGVSRPLPTKAEGAASKAKNALEIDEEAADQIAKFESDIAASRDPNSKKMLQDAYDEYIGASNIPENPTVKDLIQEHARLGAGERAAFQKGDYNLTRQFKELKDSLRADIMQADPDLAGRFSGVREAYKTQHVPYFSRGSTTEAISRIAPENAGTAIDQIFPRASDKRAFEKASRAAQLMEPGELEGARKAFVDVGIKRAAQGADVGQGMVGWWNKYADPRNNDKVLRLALGERYDALRQTVNTFKGVRPADIDRTLKTTLSEINKRGAGQLKSIEKTRLERLGGSLEGSLSEGENFVREISGSPKTLSSQTSAELKALHKEIDEKVLAVTGKPFSAERSRGYGALLVTGGLAALPSGSPFAMAAVVKGGLMIIGAPGIAKLMNSVRGASLLSKAARAVPGTTQASAYARQIQTLLREGEESGSRR